MHPCSVSYKQITGSTAGVREPGLRCRAARAAWAGVAGARITEAPWTTAEGKASKPWKRSKKADAAFEPLGDGLSSQAPVTATTRHRGSQRDWAPGLLGSLDGAVRGHGQTQDALDARLGAFTCLPPVRSAIAVPNQPNHRQPRRSRSPGLAGRPAGPRVAPVLTHL